ncbi:M20/M25/M40 family metallo-hydrolase [Sphingomonas sp. AP4-R1]|uniref:M20/M25/M40 family metallo-hydrolase n=1 Tax=Sphingomonas sp. AP4-R1 TaxID=2735134 RepID=UPI00149345CE|nr:M20/M25/M40 family metallo-hydrolase [Sphingomonas sp. AP4-R1]QJU56481.1 M20/M25/M40 family metallo-hydrolase [Sphingomonas sp. AP4-R1]
MRYLAFPLFAALLSSTPALAALSPPERKMVASVDAHTEGDIALLGRMVDLNSGSRNFAGVKAMADLMRAELEPLGFTVSWTPMEQVTGRAGHLIAEHKGSGRGSHMLLIGHMDTVFEKDSPFQTMTRKGDIVTGPGVDDMKGGLVVMIAALRAMKDAGTLKAADIHIILSGDEESVGQPQHKARAAMIEQAKWADTAFEFEGLANEGGEEIGSIARRGSISWRLSASAKSGHSSGVFSDGAGFGANYELVRIVDAFRRELREPNLTYNLGLILGGVDVTATPTDTIAGSARGKPNIIAAQAIATGDIRALSNEQAERIMSRMRAIVAQHLAGTSAEIVFSEGYPAMPPTPGSRALLGKLNGVNADLGLPKMAELDPMKRGAGDIAFAAPYTDGLVGTGIAGAGSHAEGETASLSSMGRQAKRNAILFSRLAVAPRKAK